MKIIYLLSGPGTKEGFSKEIKDVLKKDLKNKKQITFIASSPDNYSKNDLYVYGDGDKVTGMKNHLKEVTTLDNINILDSRVSADAGKKLILSSEIVYLLGGDPQSQLKYLQDNGYDKALEEYQGIILGTSAGAMNLAVDAYYSKDEDYDKSFFYKGVGIVDITVDPHFDIDNFEQVSEDKKYSNTRVIIGLPNESAIRIDNNEVTYINKCFIFNKGKFKEESNEEN
ncbi:MAG: hypothetical protein E7164_03650 [Firmicutes bacterium]|nr:hypothetical protein [Bacillota bacterium]